MKKLSLLGILIPLAGPLLGQNQPFFNHFMMNSGFINPACTGANPYSSLYFQYRSQWTGYTTSFDGAGGAPSTQMFSLSAPVMNFILSGIGINLINDRLAPLTSQQIQIPMSYSWEVRKGRVSVGVMPGIHSRIQDFGKLRLVEPEPQYQGGKESQIRPSLSAGGYFQSNRQMSVGLSVVNVIRSSFDFGRKNFKNQLERTYYSHFSKTFEIKDRLSVQASAIVISDLERITFTVNTLLIHKKKMWTGLSYNLEESLALFLGYSLLKDNSLKIGYSFDYILHGRSAKEPISNEIFVKYNLPNLIFGGRKSIKTPRFMF